MGYYSPTIWNNLLNSDRSAWDSVKDEDVIEESRPECDRYSQNLMEQAFYGLYDPLAELSDVPPQGMEVEDSLMRKAMEMDEFRLCITPEGTRSRTADWKKGFYFIALKANMPILLYGLDYEQKRIQCTKTSIPSGDLDRDMRDIKLYYQHFKGKKPENFTIGELV